MNVNSLVDRYRDRIVDRATDPFGHAEYPLARTLDHPGDPGLFGPDSVSWRVIGDAAAFVGGVRALLVQAVHPEVVAGVADHSSYQADPLGRLSRTSAYVTATTFGALPEVEQAVARVRQAHRPVTGRSHRNVPYSAGKPEFAAWVHNVLTDSFLQAYQAYGPTTLTPEEADRFVLEQTEVGRLLDADPLPETASELADWVAFHPALDESPGMAETRTFLSNPPLDPLQRVGYQALYRGALPTIPRSVLDLLDLEPTIADEPIGRRFVAFLRWALGSSPSWHVSLVRVGAEIPDGLFRQPLPVEDVTSIGTPRHRRPVDAAS
jgi:uncharacterized protein (DUF2236 family)